MVREAGLEPARPEWTLEPESSESTNSTTRPYLPASFPQRSDIVSQQAKFVNNYLSILVIEHTVAIALEIRVCDLLPEFLTDALIVLRPLQPTGAVASRALQTFPNGFYQFLVVIEPNRHHPTLPFREHYKSAKTACQQNSNTLCR